MISWYCEMQDKSILWFGSPDDHIWPTFCPICGRAVNRDLSTHHWIGQRLDSDAWQIFSGPKFE